MSTVLSISLFLISPGLNTSPICILKPDVWLAWCTENSIGTLSRVPCYCTSHSSSHTWSTAQQYGIPTLLRMHVELLEKAQKVCLKNWSSDYSNLLSTANISTLSSRRSQARLSHMFKILHKHTDFPDAPIIHKNFHYNSKFYNSLAIRSFQCRSLKLLFPQNLISVVLSTYESGVPKLYHYLQTLHCKFNLGLHVPMAIGMYIQCMQVYRNYYRHCTLSRKKDL